MPLRKKDHIQHNKKNSTLKEASFWLSSGAVQGFVLLNGIIFTLAIFFISHLYIERMATQDYKRTSQEIGTALVRGISDFENTINLVTGVLNLSDVVDKESVSRQIRESIPHLGHFDQVVWLYEKSPGNWHYETLYEVNYKRAYHFKPDSEIITRIVGKGFFADEKLRLISDFAGMDYLQTEEDQSVSLRPFSFVKAVEKNNSGKGIVIGISRISFLLDRIGIAKNNTLARFTVRNVDNGRRIYHMDHREHDESDVDSTLKQDYGFSVGDAQWQILLEFMKARNIVFLQRVPYLIMCFCLLLTVFATFFVRSQQQYSKKLSHVNRKLEKNNRTLNLENAERERLNKRLASAEKDNRAVIDAVSDIIFETDINGNILFLSKAWQTITGFDIERSQGNNLISMLYPQDQKKHAEDFEELVRGRKQAYRSFTRLRIEDGTFRAVELAPSMIRKDKDDNLRVVGTITDVEERRRAERALAEAEKKYRTIVENAAGGLYQLTPEGMYLSANPAMARILGYDSPEDMLRLVKKAQGQVYAPSQSRDDFIEDLLKNDHVFGYETKVARKNGERIWVRENVRVVRDEQRNVLYFEGSMEDITKRKEADLALIEAKIQSDTANRAKTEFIANMSHELRTPLNAIIGFSDIMKKEVMGPLGQDMYKDYVTDIHSSGQNLLKIINEILDISKIEAGERELNESEFSLTDVVHVCLDLYAGRAKGNDINVVNSLSDMPRVIGEELAVKQVVGNIYTNALKYTPSKGRVTFVSHYDDHGNFHLSVTDTGIGMSQDEVDKALSPFGQVDNALDRDGSGIGLGLPLACAVMRIHDGDVEIMSEKSIGTTVTMVFPASRVVKSSAIHTS